MPDDPDFTESTVESRQVYRGVLLDVRSDLVRLPNGQEAHREYIVHPGAAVIVPLLADGGVLLERQYRYPIRRHVLELPAGKIDPGEDAATCAARELLEETGYQAGSWRRLGGTYPCVGYSDERIELFIASDLRYLGHPGEDGEFLQVLSMPLSSALDEIRRGGIVESKTILALLWVDRIFRDGW